MFCRSPERGDMFAAVVRFLSLSLYHLICLYSVLLGEELPGCRGQTGYTERTRGEETWDQTMTGDSFYSFKDTQITISRYAMFPTMKIMTWNVQGLRYPQKRMKVLLHLKRLGGDVALLQEAHLKNEDFHRMRRLWVWLSYRFPVRWQKGRCPNFVA